MDATDVEAAAEGTARYDVDDRGITLGNRVGRHAARQSPCSSQDRADPSPQLIAENWLQGLRAVAVEHSAGGLMSAHRPRRVFDASGSDSSAGRLLPADRTDTSLTADGLLRMSTSTRRGRDAQKKHMFCGELYRTKGHMSFLSGLAAKKRQEQAARRKEGTQEALRRAWSNERLRVGDTVGAGGRRS